MLLPNPLCNVEILQSMKTQTSEALKASTLRFATAIKTRQRTTYKAAVKIYEMLSCKSKWTKKEEERFARATAKKKGRAYFASWPQSTFIDPTFAHRIEGGIAAKGAGETIKEKRPRCKAKRQTRSRETLNVQGGSDGQRDGQEAFNRGTH